MVFRSVFYLSFLPHILVHTENFSCICRMKTSPISIEIDRLTNSIVEVATGQILATVLIEVSAADDKYLDHFGSFDWLKETKKSTSRVFKLVMTSDTTTIQGLISLSDGNDHIIVNLVENAPSNIGKNKHHEGVGGNLFAFACQYSFECGYDGFISFVAKTSLLSHYEKALGAQRIGSSTRMIIDTGAASILVSHYFPIS